MKYKKTVKAKKSDIIVPDIDDNEEEDDEDEGIINNLVVPNKLNKRLKKVQDDWVKSYIIN